MEPSELTVRLQEIDAELGAGNVAVARSMLADVIGQTAPMFAIAAPGGVTYTTALCLYTQVRTCQETHPTEQGRWCGWCLGTHKGLRLVPNGLDGLQESTARLSRMGRLDPVKRLHNLVDALQQCDVCGADPEAAGLNLLCDACLTKLKATA